MAQVSILGVIGLKQISSNRVALASAAVSWFGAMTKFFLKNRNDNDNKKRLSHVYTPTFSIARWRRKASSKNSFRKTGPNVCVLSIVLYSNCVIEITKVYYHFLFVFFFFSTTFRAWTNETDLPAQDLQHGGSPGQFGKRAWSCCQNESFPDANDFQEKPRFQQDPSSPRHKRCQ